VVTPLFARETCKQSLTYHILHPDRLVLVEVAVQALAMVFDPGHAILMLVENVVNASQILLELSIIALGVVQQDPGLVQLSELLFTDNHAAEQLVNTPLLILHPKLDRRDER
jgi:hypothetical protein